MIRILFIDDEPKVTEGLRRMLHTMRREWEMYFVQSGAEALELLKMRPFDVIVSDMRMPGMDGAKLLIEVMRLYPQMVRIILSGYADKEMTLRSVGTAHQYLSKPCDDWVLKMAVTRVYELRNLLANDTLRLLVTQLKTLPSLPSLYFDLVHELQSPDSSVKKAGEIIAQDPGMTAKVLQMVNSAFFGLSRRISNSTEAVSLLGLDMITSLTLSIQVFSRFDNARLSCLSVHDLWARSMRVGTYARLIAKAEKQDRKTAEDAFTAGMLHDTGQLVLAANLPEQYCEALALARDEQIPLVEAELRILGATHAEVGAYLLGLWGLPYPIVEAVAFHHSPLQCPPPTMFQPASADATHTSGIEPQPCSPLTAVHVASVLEGELHDAGQMPEETSQLSTEYLDKLDLNARLPVWREICSQAAQAVKNFELDAAPKAAALTKEKDDERKDFMRR